MDSLLSPSSCYIEKHSLVGSEEALRFAVGKNVILNVEHALDQQQRVRDSARASSQVLSDYKWECKSGASGPKLAARDKLVAYRLFNEASGEAVRVLERESRARHLIKDFRHATVDLQWATHVPLLAVLDANANLYIYSVDENGLKLSKYLIIIQEDDRLDCGPAHLVWCPYIPEEDVDAEREEVHMLAVVQGARVNLFQLHKIKEAIGRTEVTYERVKEVVTGGILTVTLDSDITACRISPDATALALASADGQLNFYVVEETGTQEASQLHPLGNNAVEQMVFLDNLCPNNANTQEQFWKYVALCSDSGRRLAIFDCDTWECLAKLRFEAPHQVGKMELLVEQSTQFLFLADYDGSNLFCIELSISLAGAPICFAACTQIAFVTPLLCVVPCSLTMDQNDNDGDLSFEDDETPPHSSVIATLVAITNRSLLELNIELDRVFTVDPSVALLNAPHPVATARSLHQSQQNLEHQKEETGAEKAAATALDGNAAITAMLKVSSTRNHTNSTGSGSRMLAELMEQKFAELSDKLEDVSLQVRQLQAENEQLRSTQNDNLSNVLEKISNELKLREERIEATVAKSGQTFAEQVQGAVADQMAKQTEKVQRAIELSQTRQAEEMHGSVERVVIPQVEVLCSQLFQQLNDSFRAGLQEFMEQMRAISAQQQAATAAAAEKNNTAAAQARQLAQQPPPLDQNSLQRFIDSNQINLAFDLVVKSGDQKLLNFLCKKVDPDEYFAVSATNNTVPMPIPILLGVFNLISAKLDSETDLRFRYVENLLLSLTSRHGVLKRDEWARMVLNEKEFKLTLERLSKSFSAFAERDGNTTWKRQTRIISQLIATLLR